MGSAAGFDYTERNDGCVVVFHHGQKAATLRGDRARQFLVEVASGDAQTVMARWTGNYRRGNERTARSHPRNAGR